MPGIHRLHDLRNNLFTDNFLNVMGKVVNVALWGNHRAGKGPVNQCQATSNN